jgi:hypothetical protein
MSLGARLPTPQSRSDAVRCPATSPEPGWAQLIRRHRSDHHACHLPEEGWSRLIFADASPAAGRDRHRPRAGPRGLQPARTATPGPVPAGPAQRADPTCAGSADPRAHRAVRRQPGQAAPMTRQQADRASNCIIRVLATGLVQQTASRSADGITLSHGEGQGERAPSRRYA